MSRDITPRQIFTSMYAKNKLTQVGSASATILSSIYRSDIFLVD
jgi:hypothetical protein